VTGKVTSFSALFFRLIIVILDVRAANIALDSDHRAANIG
jgi:hypothetical protein